jgi:hypothetical protein
MFPMPAFNPAVKSAVAGHRGSVMFSLSRDFHFDKEREGGVSLRQYFASRTVAVNDDLGVVVIPEKTLLYAIHVDILGGTPGATGVLRIRNTSASQPQFEQNAFSLATPTSFVVTSDGSILDATQSTDYADTGCCPKYFPVANVLDLRITARNGTNEFGGAFTKDTRIRISPIIIAPLAGGP